MKLEFHDSDFYPHQLKFLWSTAEETALISGYGAGKTHIFCRKVLLEHLTNKSHVTGKSAGWVIEPTYSLLDELFLEPFIELLDKIQLKHKYNAQKRVITTNAGRIRGYTMMHPKRMIGSNLTFCGVDELDTTGLTNGIEVYRKCTGRLRGSKTARFFATTTPEGFAAAYDIFGKKEQGHQCVIHAKTTDNESLDQAYIDKLYRTYPSNLVDAYINGKFVNMTSGSVFLYFDRERHHVDSKPEKGDILHIGQDFNVGGCISSVYVQRHDSMHLVDEWSNPDTEQVVTCIKDRYPDHGVIFYPDATGTHGTSTNASKSDIGIITGAGFRIDADGTNALIKDRVNATNRMMEANRWGINTNRCPGHTTAFEQHAWDQRTGKPQKFAEAGSIDDYTDAATYPVVRLHPINRPNHTTTRRLF